MLWFFVERLKQLCVDDFVSLISLLVRGGVPPPLIYYLEIILLKLLYSPLPSLLRQRASQIGRQGVRLIWSNHWTSKPHTNCWTPGLTNQITMDHLFIDVCWIDLIKVFNILKCVDWNSIIIYKLWSLILKDIFAVFSTTKFKGFWFWQFVHYLLDKIYLYWGSFCHVNLKCHSGKFWMFAGWSNVMTMF